MIATTGRAKGLFRPIIHPTETPLVPMSLLLLLWPLLLTRRPEQASPLWARRSLVLLTAEDWFLLTGLAAL